MQAFPWNSWEQEFERAEKIGFAGLELLFEQNRFASNPIWHSEGRQQIINLAARHNVYLPSVCAHFFAQCGLGSDLDSSDREISLLSHLIQACASLHIHNLLIPFLEAASLNSTSKKQNALSVLSACQVVAAENQVYLALETDLSGPDCKELMQALDSQWFGVCYDTGNAVALGYDPQVDLRLLMPWLREVHIKDRLRSGETLQLGFGDSPFPSIFDILLKSGYQGPLILETPVGEDWESNARRNLDFVRSQLNQVQERVKSS